MLRSILRIPIGHGCTVVVHSRNRRSFPGPGFLKVDWTAFGVWYWVIWQEARWWGSRNDLGWLVSWKTLWNWCFWGILCLSFGAWFILCRAVVWPRLVAKLSERGFLFARIEWWMIRRICGRNLEMGAAVLVGCGLEAVETLDGGIVTQTPRGRAVLLHRLSSSSRSSNSSRAAAAAAGKAASAEQHQQSRQWQCSSSRARQ